MPLSFYIYTSFRPAPTARTSQARPCLWCRSQLAGGTPPGPPGTHASSQFWYTSLIPVFLHISYLMAWWWLQPFHTHFSYTGIFWCTSFIWIINVILRPALIPQHLLRLAMPGAQYFTVPLPFLQESAGIRRNPPESAGMRPESAGILRNETRIHRNPQEWNTGKSSVHEIYVLNTQ